MHSRRGGLGDISAVNAGNVILYEMNEYMKTGNIEFESLVFYFNRMMQLKFEYRIEDEKSELCSTALLLEDAEGWRVTKIEARWSPYQ